MGDIKKIVGNRIRDLRNGRGWSQEELADRATVSRSFMGEIERGQASATIESLEKVTIALEITLEDLFRDLRPSTDSKLSVLMNKMNCLSAESLKEFISFAETLYDWKCKKDQA
ncbi:helix-turn-helix domain-containing protein [Oxobacter pfennigii]|nr:helix-turn-helix transcriptional regulator [Oxobacter pfennigii]